MKYVETLLCDKCRMTTVVEVYIDFYVLNINKYVQETHCLNCGDNSHSILDCDVDRAYDLNKGWE